MTFSSIVSKLLSAMNMLAILLIGVAAFLLVYGIFRYIAAGADEKRRTEGRKLFLWGLIALFVMISFWGLVRILLNTFFSSSSLHVFQLNSSLWQGI